MSNLEKIKNFFSKKEWWVFLSTLFASLLARGIILFNLAYQTDDYSAILFRGFDFTLFLRWGRWGGGLLGEFFDHLGLNYNYALTWWAFFSFVVFSFVVILVCRLWKIRENFLLSLLVSLIIVLHPYQAELYTFKIAIPTLSFALLFSFIAIYKSKLKTFSIIWTSLLFGFALSVYQTVFNYLLMVLVFSLLFELWRYQKELKSIKTNKFFWKSESTPKFLTLSLGALFYLISNKIFLFIFQKDFYKERVETLKISAWRERFLELINLYKKIFLDPEYVLPRLDKYLLLFLLLAFVLSIFYLAYKLWQKKEPFKSFLGVIMVLLALLAIPGLLLSLKNWYSNLRPLSAVSFFWSGVFVTLILFFHPRLKKLWYFIIPILVISFVGINNTIFLDQIRINKKDFLEANRIIGRLESQPNFSEVKKIVFFGILTKKYFSPDQTTDSAFTGEYSKLKITEEATRYSFPKPIDEENKIAADYCQGAPVWPYEGSVTIMENLGIVCLSNLETK